MSVKHRACDHQLVPWHVPRGKMGGTPIELHGGRYPAPGTHAR
ncbi:MAG TPA: hypothetical protein VN044_08855 [Verrucomicrobiae bacterium]|nr:hypothetical protein [Verrucomicrobiae bacterium]